MSDKSQKTPYSYQAAGVDIDAGEALIDKIASPAKATKRSGCMGGLGGFGAMFDVKAAGYEDPILVSGTDGVGTKLKVGIDTGRVDTLGIDLVAMCVNDILCQGAEPLFFLDYFATGALETDVAAKVVAGIAEGCRRSGCALIGGETAEMPGLYGDGEFDLAGFAVGAVERDKILPDHDGMMEGDVLLGLPSSGLHSNGYSLIRHIVKDLDLSYDDPAPFDSKETVADVLLAPTKLYIESVLPVMKQGLIKAAAHITGGGLPGNVPRVLPKHLAVEIEEGSWARSPLFQWLKDMDDLPDVERRRTFNDGIGLVLVVAAEEADQVTGILKSKGEEVYTVGRVVATGDEEERCRFV